MYLQSSSVHSTRIFLQVVEMFPKTMKVVALFACLQLVAGGYVPSTYYPSVYPTFVQRPVLQPAFVRPVTTVQVPQKQPLQLRPPSRPAIALPNTGPPVIAVHAESRPQQSQAVSVPVSNPGLPVVAIQAQQQQFQQIPASAPRPQGIPVVAIQAQNQIQTIPTLVSRPQQGIPVVAISAPPRKIVLPVPTQIASVPNYSFGYAVKDLVTGDEKSHHESRTGDNVVGEYSVVEPDGTLRTVRYTAGANGFNAVITRTPGYAPPNAPAKVVSVAKPVVVASPVLAPAVISKPIAIAGRPVAVNPVPTYPSGFHFGG